MDKETLDTLVRVLFTSSVVGVFAWYWYAEMKENHLHLGKDSAYTRSSYYIKNLFTKGKFKMDYDGF